MHRHGGDGPGAFPDQEAENGVSILAYGRPERLLPRSSAWFRRRMFLGLRLLTRLGEAATALHLGLDHSWALALAAVACAGLDLRLAAVLARPGRSVLWRRLILDVLDVVLWTLALHGAGDLTVIAASPLLLEAGLWHGRRSLPLPFVIGTAAMATVAFTNGRIDPLPYLWPLSAWFGGVLAGTYLRRRWHAEAGLVRDRLDAAADQAELSGQNSVAMGADSVVDLLVRTAPLVTSYERKPVPLPFGAWKARLAEACGRHATYLGVALSRWQGLYNSRSPDLSADVDLRPDPGAGTLLLSPGQTRYLEGRLEAMGLRGTVRVSVPRLGPVGEAQVVIVDGERVVVPADERHRLRPVHGGPFFFVAAAVLVLTQSLPQWDGVPLWCTGTLALLSLAAAWWAHRRTYRPAHEVAGSVMAVAVLLALVQSMATSAMLAPGSGRLPFLFFLQWAVPLAFVHAKDLPRRQLVITGLGFVAAVGAGMAAMPVAFSVTGMLLGVPWWIAPALAVQGLRDLMEEDSADLHEQLGRLHDGVMNQAYKRGRRQVIELTEDASEQLRRRYRALGPELPPEIAAEIERRLVQARAMLAALPAD